MSYVSNSLGSGMLAGPTGLLGAFYRSTPAPLADLLSFSNRETGNARLGASKVAGPSAQPNSKSLPCRAAYFFGIVEVVLPSRKQGKSGTPILNPANVESRDRGGLVKFSDSVRLHGASETQAKVLKGTEKNLFLIYTSRKWAENSGVIVIMDVSVTTP